MASTTFEERLQKINILKSFIKSVDEKLKVIVDDLNWTYESLDQKGKSLTVSCSIHPKHQVHNSRIEQHEEKCQWLKNGYHLDDLPFPENHGQGSCVVFTPEIQEMIIKNTCSEGNQSLAYFSFPPSKYKEFLFFNEINFLHSKGEEKKRNVPQTSARLDQEFNRNEKLALYNYVIANTKRQKLYEQLASICDKDTKNEKKVMTPLEIAAAERDAKRRRASYRNKVHTNRKTQTEILREVIESQMESLKEEVTSQNFKEKDNRKQYDANYRKEPYDFNRSESSKSEYSSEKYHKKSDDYWLKKKDFSERHSKHSKQKEGHKSKKRKKSRSRSRSHERRKHRSKHSDRHSSHKSYNRH